MTSVLSCLVATIVSAMAGTIALAADPSPQGLPFGVPPAADDAVIAHVAPPHCLLYANWAGTASPNASSASETEKLLAEPEVQELLGGVNRMIVSALKNADKEKKEAGEVGSQTLPSPYYLNDDVQYFPPSTMPLRSRDAPPAPTSGAIVPPPASFDPYAKPDTPEKANTKVYTPSPGAYAPRDRSDQPAELPITIPDVGLPPATDKPVILPQPLPTATKVKPAFNVSAEDYGDWINVILTHPTAVFIEDMKVTPPKEAEKKSHLTEYKIEKTPATSMVLTLTETTATPEGTTEVPPAIPFLAEVHAGMVVSLGPDSPRLHVKFLKYLRKAKKAGLDRDFEPVQIAGQTWCRSKPYKLGLASDKVRLTFGFHGPYFVVGIGDGAVEGILARWNIPAPAWLATALKETPVPRRTGIVYANLKSLRETLLPLAASQKSVRAWLDILGLSNVDSLISTTGLEDRGMINRVLLTIDGKPSGLLDVVAERPLAANDLKPIPSNALMAFAARVDVDRAITTLISAYEKAGAAGNSDSQKTVDDLKKNYGVDAHRLLAAIGDTWCVYNSPTEGEIPFLGWTAVVPIRDRAALAGSWKTIFAANKAKEAAKEAAREKTPGVCELYEPTTKFSKCSFAGHEIYYVAEVGIAPAMCIMDHELVMTLNMPAMKAYLTRKDHQSLATLPGVKLALGQPNAPLALAYFDTPRLFDVLYPMLSCVAVAGASAAQQSKLDLDPTYWPSAPSIRSHLRPDITTVERTAHGLQLTCRYSLPAGGATGPLCLVGLDMLGGGLGGCVIPVYSGDPRRRAQDGFDIPAEFDGLIGKKVVVVCKPVASQEFSNSGAAKALEEGISERLKAKIKDIKIIDPQKVNVLIDEEGLEDYVAIGRKLKADKVVAVDIESFGIFDGQTLYRGRSTVSISVYDVAEKNREWHKLPPIIEYPRTGSIPAADLAENEFRGKFVKIISEQVAQLFYPHDTIDVYPYESSATVTTSPPATSQPMAQTPSARIVPLCPIAADPTGTICPATPYIDKAASGHATDSQQAVKAAASQIYFAGPEGLTVQWDVTALGRFDSEKLVAPGRYNFPQGALYRLKLANIPGRPGLEIFPSLEVAAALPRTAAYLEHNAIPVEFSGEDFDQVMAGNSVTKVIYLPDPEFQEKGLAGVGTLISTRLDPGVDPIVEADRRGAIMAIVRLSAANKPNSPSVLGRPIAAGDPAGTTYPVTPYIAAPDPPPVPGASSGCGCGPVDCPCGAAPAIGPGSRIQIDSYLYTGFNAGPSPATGGLAANPAFGTAVKVTDIIAMNRAKVDDRLIISQIRNHGLAAPLRPADVITLSQNGVSPDLISAMQTVVAKEEYSDPSTRAPKVLNSNYETSPPAQTPPKSARPMPDPNRRAQEPIYTSENLRLLQDEWERSNLAPSIRQVHRETP
jgi:hypothetical protein